MSDGKSATLVNPRIMEAFSYVLNTPRYALIKGAVVSYLVRGSEIVLKVKDPQSVSALIELLTRLGLIVEKRDEHRIEPDEGFRRWLYEISEDEDGETPRQHWSYINKMRGLTIDEAIKAAKNNWMKKTLKLYLRYLFENNVISEDVYTRYKMKIKVKQSNHRRYKYIPDKKIRDSVWSIVGIPHQFLAYLALAFSGVRRNELWKMLKEFDPNKLFCTEDFCRYELAWIRGRKRCDYIYLPRWLLEKLLEYRDKLASIREDSLENLVKRRRREGRDILPTSELRDWHYNVCLEVLEATGDEDPRINICRLYQGRELNVSGEYYQFLVRKADAFYPKLMQEIMNRVRVEVKDLENLGKIKGKIFDDYMIGDPDIEVDEESVIIDEYEDEEELIDDEEEQLIYEYRAEI